MKIEIELDKEGYCKDFKINDKSYGMGIERVNIDIEYKTRIDMFIHSKTFNETELEENELINVYESKK